MALNQLGLAGLCWLLCVTAQNLQDVCLQGSACSKKNTEPLGFVQTRTTGGKSNMIENDKHDLSEDLVKKITKEQRGICTDKHCVQGKPVKITFKANNCDSTYCLSMISDITPVVCPQKAGHVSIESWHSFSSWHSRFEGSVAATAKGGWGRFEMDCHEPGISVEIMEAKNLQHQWWWETPDLFVEMKVAGQDSFLVKTRTQYNEHHPKWHDHFALPEYQRGDKLSFTVWEEDAYHHDKMGTAEMVPDCNGESEKVLTLSPQGSLIVKIYCEPIGKR